MTTTSIICQELDAAVVQGLRLLHSADPDSEDQLRQLWKQCVNERYGLDRAPISVLNKINIPSGLKREGTQEVKTISVFYGNWVTHEYESTAYVFSLWKIQERDPRRRNLILIIQFSRNQLPVRLALIREAHTFQMM